MRKSEEVRCKSRKVYGAKSVPNNAGMRVEMGEGAV